MLIVGSTASAQENDALAIPGGIQPDSLYGRIGDWFALRSLEGETIPPSHFSERVLFVNFWATWCGPCVEEMPTIVELAGAEGESEVEFLLISIDESERDVRRFEKQHGLALPLYLRGWQPGESTFTAGIVPATFIVNKKGEIVYQHHGAANWNSEPIRGFLRSLARR
jgi:thiol-disulfide isomerase/thioredoxin